VVIHGWLHNDYPVRMAPEVPQGKVVAAIHVSGCKDGHQWFTYGEDESTHWSPALCRVCGQPEIASTVVKKLTPAEADGVKTYHVVQDARLALKSPIDAVYEEDVAAQEMTEGLSHWEFITSNITVLQLPKNWVVGKPTLKPTEYLATVPVKFVSPPANREAVYARLSPLRGWGALEPKVGSADPTLWELRLRLDATCQGDAENQATSLYPQFFERLKEAGPALAGKISAVSQKDFLAG